MVSRAKPPRDACCKPKRKATNYRKKKHTHTYTRVCIPENSPTVQARIVWAPDFAVMSARFPLADSTLWMATREADAARKDTFLPVAQYQAE